MAFSGDIDQTPATRELHARDASVFRVLPEEVAYPRTVEDIQLMLSEVAARGGSVSVRAGGTCMSGGSLTSGSVLNLTRYMNAVTIEPLTRHVHVEGGAMFKDVEEDLAVHGLMYPAYPSSKDICGVGGMIGNNASGEKSVRYGATIDTTETLEVVLADGTIIDARPLRKAELDDIKTHGTREGELYRGVHVLYDMYVDQLRKEMGSVRKVASGYRLDRFYDPVADTYSLVPLFVGAQGTLGIVTKATLKAVPKPQFVSLLAISVTSLDLLPLVVETVMNHDPDAVETFDANTFKHGESFFPEEVATTKRFFTSATELIVLAEFAADSGQHEARETASRCAEALTLLGVQPEVVGDEALCTALWKLRRNSFSVFRDYQDGTKHAVPCIEDIIVPVPALTQLIRGLKDILMRRGLGYGFHGHIGEGSLRVLPVFDLASPTVAEEIIGLSREVFALVKSLHGNMSADHSDGIMRTPFIREFYPTTCEAFVQIKKLFDPANLLNPGKKVGGTEADIRKHLIQVT